MDRDPATLLDIVIACRKLIGFVAGRSRADLDEDLMLQFAVLHAIAIVGEAANRLSPGFRQAHPTIPWASSPTRSRPATSVRYWRASNRG
jgi:uncharacterized protein with HEPN domain